MRSTRTDALNTITDDRDAVEALLANPRWRDVRRWVADHPEILDAARAPGLDRAFAQIEAERGGTDFPCERERVRLFRDWLTDARCSDVMFAIARLSIAHTPPDPDAPFAQRVRLAIRADMSTFPHAEADTNDIRLRYWSGVMGNPDVRALPPTALAEVLVHLGHAMLRHFGTHRAYADLDLAFRYLATAFGRLDEADALQRHPALSDSLIGLLAEAARLRFARDQNPEELAFAAHAARIAAGEPDTAPAIAATLGHAQTWLDRHDRSGARKDLAVAWALAQECVARAGADDSHAAEAAFVLAEASRRLWDEAPNAEGLASLRTLIADGTALAERARLQMGRSPTLVHRLLALDARVSWRWFEVNGDAQDAARAEDGWKRVFVSERDDPVTELRAATAYANVTFASARWDDVDVALEYASTLRATLLARQERDPDKRGWLGFSQDLPSMHAYALARLGRLHDAAAAIDAGAAILMAERFGRHATGNPPVDPRPSTAPGPGATGLPVVYLVTTTQGGLALITDHKLTTVTPLWLDELSRDRVLGFLKRALPTRDMPFLFEEDLTDLLEWLWDAAMSALHDALGTTESCHLIPVGLLGWLPLHAATDSARSPQHAVHFLDRHRLRYAPTRTLIQPAPAPGIEAGTQANTQATTQAATQAITGTRTGSASAADDPRGRILAIGNPEMDTPRTLPASTLEVRSIAKGASSARVLVGREATRDQLLAQLADVRTLHFSGHAFSNIDAPERSALRLADGAQWTLAELLDQAQQPEHVILSACETGLSGVALPDEQINLASAFLYGGARCVVASLWPVDDLATCLLMTEFHRRWAERDHPATALTGAQCWLRDADAATLHARMMSLLAESGTDRATLGGSADELARLDRESPDTRPYAAPLYWAAFQYLGG